MYLRSCIPLACLLLLVSQGWAAAAPSSGAMDRGRLSLAWDAHEAGLFEEAVGYLQDIAPDSSVAGEAAWLYAECLHDLGRFAEAAAFLQSGRGQVAEDRKELLRDVYWDWAWDLTRREEFAEAQKVAEEGGRRLPGDEAFAGFAEASRFRERMAKILAPGGGTLPSGETVLVGPVNRSPSGMGWIRAFPWRLESPWVPDYTVEEWMSDLAGRLSSGGRALWIRVPRLRLLRALQDAAPKVGLRLFAGSPGVWAGDGGDRVAVVLEEWQYRAAVEGLGIAGAAVMALADVRKGLAARADMARWLADHRDGLEMSWSEGLWHLRDPGTGRVFQLDPVQWADLLRTDPEQWQELWADLRAELSRPPRPFRCFCGRPVYLREVLLQEPGDALVLERGSGFVVAMEALCPLHRQYVTAETVGSWGVGLVDLEARAREDAGRQPWELTFRRDAWVGTPYLFLEGEAAAALARDPELLLGALEGVDGVGARGRSVLVVAPTSASLLVADATARPEAAEQAAARSLLQSDWVGGETERLNFRTVVHLPQRGRGSFRMTAAE